MNSVNFASLNSFGCLDYPVKPDSLKPLIEIAEKEPENLDKDQYNLLNKAIYCPPSEERSQLLHYLVLSGASCNRYDENHPEKIANTAWDMNQIKIEFQKTIAKSFNVFKSKKDTSSFFHQLPLEIHKQIVLNELRTSF